MKKILRVFMSILCLCLFVTSSLTPMITAMAKGDGTTYINKDDITEHNIKVISNVAGDTSMVLYEYQSHFYITTDTVKELTGLSASVSTGNGLYCAALTDGIRTVYVNLEDRTISDEINDKTVKDSSGKEILNDINAMLYSDKFLVEAVPFLRYLGAEVQYVNGYFLCLMNRNSIWSVLPDAMEDVDKFLIPFTSYIPDYKKRLTFDIIGDYISGGNLIISAENSMNNYYKESIYDMFEVNPYSYDSVKKQEAQDAQDDHTFYDSKQLLDLGDQLKDVGVDSAKILEDLYLTKEIDWLNFKWNGAYKLGFTEEASKISKELNSKTVKLYEDTVEGGNIDKAGYVISALIYGAKIYNDYTKISNYGDDTAYCLAAEVNSMRYAYSDTSNIGWLPTADRVSKEVLDNRNNARDSILDNTVDLLQGEGNDLILSAASGELLLSMKFATFMTNLICKDIIEAEHREIITMLQQDMQYQSYNLCYELWKKAESENFSNIETVIRFVDALKFFYRFSMAYDNSIQQWGEHYYPSGDWNTPVQKRNDKMALKFYTLLNATMIPNENLFNYSAMKDDIFTVEEVESNNLLPTEPEDLSTAFYSYVNSTLIPKYGLSSLSVSEIDYNTKPNYSNLQGLTSAFIYDTVTNKRMITIRIDVGTEKPCLIFEMYHYENGKVNLMDAYSYELDEYTIGFHIGLSSGYLCFEDARHFNYVSSSFGSHSNILSIDGNGFNEVFNLCDSHAAGGYTWLHNVFADDKTYFETTDGSGDGLSAGVEAIKEDLHAVGFSNYDINCGLDPETFVFQILYDTDLLDFSLYDQIITDHTNLRSHHTESADDISLTDSATSRSQESNTASNMELDPNVHYYGTDVVNGITLNYDLYLLPNKTMISVTTPTETGGSISYFFEGITYSDGAYHYANGFESELVPGAIRSLVAANDLSGTIKIIDNETIEWTNVANTVGRSFTILLKKQE